MSPESSFNLPLYKYLGLFLAYCTFMPRCRYCLMTLGGTFHYSGLEPNYVDVGGKDGDACAKSNDDVLRGPSVCFFFFFLFFLFLFFFIWKPIICPDRLGSDISHTEHEG